MAKVGYIHFDLSGPDKSPASETFDEEEYEEGLISFDTEIRQYIKDGYTSIKLEVRVDADPRDGLPLILAMDDDYCPKSKDGTHQFGEDGSCDLCGAKEEKA